MSLGFKSVRKSMNCKKMSGAYSTRSISISEEVNNYNINVEKNESLQSLSVSFLSGAVFIEFGFYCVSVFEAWCYFAPM